MAAINPYDVLASIRRYIAENGYPPTMRELAEEYGVSRQAIRYHLARLEQEGHIERDYNLTRAIRVIEKEKA